MENHILGFKGLLIPPLRSSNENHAKSFRRGDITVPFAYTLVSVCLLRTKQEAGASESRVTTRHHLDLVITPFATDLTVLCDSVCRVLTFLCRDEANRWSCSAFKVES